MLTSKPAGPRIVFASEFWPGASARGIVPGLRAAGCLVAEVDSSHFFPGGLSTAARIEARLRRKHFASLYNQAILETARRVRAEVLMTVKGGHVATATLSALRSLGILCVNYYPDYHFNDTPIDLVTSYDLVATTKSFHLAELRRRMEPDRVYFVHHGYSDEIHHPSPDATAEKGVDLLYVGNASVSKISFLASLADSLPDVSIRIVGNRWEDAARLRSLARAVFVPEQTGEFYAAEIGRARIILAFHNGPDAKTGFADLVSTRTFEIPACGGFMLHVDNAEVRSLYDVPSEIDTFTTPDNCAAKIRYWLAHPEERLKVAARGFARAVPAYGYAARGRELIRMIEARLGA